MVLYFGLRLPLIMRDLYSVRYYTDSKTTLAADCFRSRLLLLIEQIAIYEPVTFVQR